MFGWGRSKKKKEELEQKDPPPEGYRTHEEHTSTLAVLKAVREGYAMNELEYAWTDEAMARRYLRASKGKEKRAISELVATLQWRKEFDVWNILDEKYLETMQFQCDGGKMYVGHKPDKDGCPLVCMHPARERRDQQHHENNIRYLVYTLERAVMTMPEGTERLNLLVSFENYSVSNAPPLKTSKACLRILSHHYPERLKHAFMVFPPWAFWLFWKIISPFIDSVTKNKVKFLRGNAEKVKTKLLEYVNEEDLGVDYGGALKYDMTGEEKQKHFWDGHVTLKKQVDAAREVQMAAVKKSRAHLTTGGRKGDEENGEGDGGTQEAKSKSGETSTESGDKGSMPIRA